MDVKVQIQNLTLEELTDIISTAFYGNDYMEIDYEGTPSILHECFEENVAQTLLDGGTVLITDTSYGEADDPEAYGDLPHYTDADGCITYKLTLQDFYKRASTLECLKYIQDLLSGEGDFYDGYNLMQIVTYGEIIYG